MMNNVSILFSLLIVVLPSLVIASNQEGCVQSCLQRPFAENLTRFVNMRTCEASQRIDACSAAIVGIGLGTVAAKQSSYILSNANTQDAVRKHIRDAYWGGRLDAPSVPRGNLGGEANSANLNRLQQEAGLHNAFATEVDRLERQLETLQSRPTPSAADRAAIEETRQAINALEKERKTLAGGVQEWARMTGRNANFAAAGVAGVRNIVKLAGVAGAVYTGVDFLRGRPASAREVGQFDFSDPNILQEYATTDSAHRNAAANNSRTQQSLCENSCQDSELMNNRATSLPEFSSISGCEPGSDSFSYQVRNGADYNYQISLSPARQVERIEFENMPNSTAVRTYHLELEQGDLKRICFRTGRQSTARPQCQSIESVMPRISGPRISSGQDVEMRRIVANFHQMKLFLPGVASCCNEGDSSGGRVGCSTEFNRAVNARNTTRPGPSNRPNGRQVR